MCFFTYYVSTRNNQLNSPLLHLPGELRNRIYEYVYFDAKVVVEDHYFSYSVPRRKKSPIHVLATCQQIRHEATTIFWNECTIDARVSFLRLDLQSAMGSSNCARITSLVVHQDILSGQKEYNSTVPISNPLAYLPLLRKVVLEGYWFDEEAEAVLRCIRAEGVEVECIEHNWTKTDDWPDWVSDQ